MHNTEVGDRLIAWAEGSLSDMAGVHAMVNHPYLLARTEVVQALVVVEDEEDEDGGGTWCDWAKFGQRFRELGLSGGERRFVELVLSLADVHQVALGAALDALDAENTRIILEAMLISGGKRNHLGVHSYPMSYQKAVADTSGQAQQPGSVRVVSASGGKTS